MTEDSGDALVYEGTEAGGPALVFPRTKREYRRALAQGHLVRVTESQRRRWKLPDPPPLDIDPMAATALLGSDRKRETDAPPARTGPRAE